MKLQIIAVADAHQLDEKYACLLYYRSIDKVCVSMGKISWCEKGMLQRYGVYLCYNSNIIIPVWI